jgi:hypothetical protein
MPVTRFQRANQFAFDPSLGRRADAVDDPNRQVDQVSGQMPSTAALPC